MKLIEDSRGPSFFERLEQDKSQPVEKMSKSRGNVITIDEIVSGVTDLSPGFEFRDCFGVKIHDFRKLHVWRAKYGDGNFYAGTQFNGVAKEMLGLERLPIFLHFENNPIPCRLLINGREMMQHSKYLTFWNKMAEKFPDEFHAIPQEEQISDYELAGVYSKIG